MTCSNDVNKLQPAAYVLYLSTQPLHLGNGNKTNKSGIETNVLNQVRFMVLSGLLRLLMLPQIINIFAPRLGIDEGTLLSTLPEK